MKTLFQTWLLTSFLYSLTSAKLIAQPALSNHFDLNIGLSTAEALNIGTRYNFGQNSIGVNVGGGLPSIGAWQIIPSLSYYRHLWGHSRHTLILPWYMKAAVQYEYFESELTRGNTSSGRSAGARLYLGRDFNITPRLNFSTALGPMLFLLEDYYGHRVPKPRLVPGMDLSIFYKL